MSDSRCGKTDDCCAPSPLVLPPRPVAKAAPSEPPAPMAVASCCCSAEIPAFDGMDPRYKRALWAVIAINAAMFLTEIVAGHFAGSQALKADALDFLADTVTYGLSLAVIGASLATRSAAAFLKGASLSVMAAWVLGSTLFQVLILGLPSAELMGGIGVLALFANLASVGLLMRYKDGDANVRSVWLCSRNDAIGNIAVVAAAFGVWGSATAWPDLAVAGFMAAIFFSSSLQILRQAWAEYRTTRGDGQIVAAE